MIQSNWRTTTIMMRQRSVKATAARPQLVAVIGSRADLDRAARLRSTPDLFELRLDQLVDELDELESYIAQLRAPLIITARHPAEGGAHHLNAQSRRALLLRFLPRSRYVDVELRSTKLLRPVIERARATAVGLIVSAHDFHATPSDARLDEIARSALATGADILKIAVRTDTPDELLRLQHFYERHVMQLPISAMGVGKLGRVSRRWFARRAAALHYAHLGTPAAEGQLSLAELRRLLMR